MPSFEKPQRLLNRNPEYGYPKKIFSLAPVRTERSSTLPEKIQKSPGLQHWASVKNLKTAATDNLFELQKQIEEKTSETKSARAELVQLEHQMKKVSEPLLYAELYRDNKPF